MAKTNKATRGMIGKEREARKLAAEQRKKERDLLTDKQQLAVLAKRPGKSKKETDRLKAKIAAAK